MKINEIENNPRDVTVIDRPKIGSVSKGQEEIKPPNMYEVVLHNDDFTHAEYVVDMLHRFFNKNLHDAIGIMMNAHQMGQAMIAIYPEDIAKSKVQGAMAEARSLEHPLNLTAEPV
jgi:ATP-dependent Clp protease adaptor protein ClpS